MNGTDPPPMQLCYSYYAEGGIINNTYVFDPNITEGEKDYRLCLTLVNEKLLATCTLDARYQGRLSSIYNVSYILSCLCHAKIAGSDPMISLLTSALSLFL